MDLLRDWWGAAVTIIGAIIWLMRLEARSLSNEKEIKRMAEQRKEDMVSAQKQRDDSNAMLTEIRRDVKILLTAKGQ